MNISVTETHTVITDIGDFSLERTLESGQCFRYVKTPYGYKCAAGNRMLLVSQNEDTLVLLNVASLDTAMFWAEYFDLKSDYRLITDCLSRADSCVADAITACPGIHILRQEPWETLCCFIISQNNNIPRIKKIVFSLCSLFGKADEYDFGEFPSADTVARSSEEALAPIRAGFRAGYIIDAARKVADGTVDLGAIRNMELGKAAEELKKIRGVGDKVAACSLLFGFGMLDSFPVDVWVKKVIAKYYGDSFTPELFSPYAGVAQQYLFYRERTL